jgi:L-fuculose-phosphate aldolase
MTHHMQQARLQLLNACQTLDTLGLNRGTSGNVSLRTSGMNGEPGFLITPSGIPVSQMHVDDLVWMDFEGNYSVNQKPSSEWRFHLDILQVRQEVNTVVHTHSLFATSFSTLRQDLPAFHYMIAVAGGRNVRCAPYAVFGSQLLSDHAIEALQNRHACLLANHGLIATGHDLTQAINLAEEIEALCQQYMHVKQMGEPVLLSDTEMDDVMHQFKGYGNWAK